MAAARLALLVVLALAGTARAAVDTCVACHVKLKDRELARQVGEMEGDVHQRAGLSCHSCHGGDPTVGMDDRFDSMDATKGYIGVFPPANAAAMCARCHADAQAMARSTRNLPTSQWLEFKASRHGQLTMSGDKRSATCSSCHRAHGVFEPGDPRSSVSPAHEPRTCGACHADPKRVQKTDQLARYENSVHWRAARTAKDRSAPVCHDCHGSHAQVPHGLSSVEEACGKCHAMERQIFQRGAHVKKLGAGGCVKCHAEHDVQEASDRLLGAAGPCLQCHDKAGRARDMALELAARLGALQGVVDRVSSDLAPMALKGIPTRECEEALDQGLDELRTARRLVHTDSLTELKPALDRAERALGEALRVTRAAADERAGEEAEARRVALLLAVLALTFAIKAGASWNARRVRRHRTTMRYQV